MANPSVIVDFIANTSKLSAGVSDVEQSGGRLKSTFGGVAGAVAKGLAVGAVVSFGKSAVSAAEESESSTKRLAQVFGQMGDKTGEAAKAATSYAGELSKQIGVEDETIQNAQTMLAVFGKVSGETARQAGIFDRTTAAAADLAAAGFGSIESNAKLLGKALEEPEKGFGKLARAGVVFTDAQKEQITAMVEAGKTTEAQSAILGQLEGKVKGTAAATATEASKTAIAFGEMQESMGKALLPVIQEITPLLGAMAGFLAENSGWLVPLAGVIVGIVGAMKLWAAAQIALNFAMSANPIGLIIIGIGLLAAAIVLIVKNWDTVVAAFETGWEAIQTAAEAVFNWVKANWPLLLAILMGPLGLAVGQIITHWDTIKSTFTTATNAVKGVVTAAWDAIKNTISTVGNAIKTAISTAWDAIQTAVETAVNAVKSTVTTVWNGIKGVITGAQAGIETAVNAVASAFDTVSDAATSVLSLVTTAFNGISGAINAVIGAVKRAAQAVADAIMGPINWAKGKVNDILGAFNNLRIPGFSISIPMPGPIPDINFAWGGLDLPDIPLLAAGAVISRPTLAMVGEGAGREIVAPEDLLRQIVSEGAGASYTLNMNVQRANAADIQYGFRRLELARAFR